MSFLELSQNRYSVRKFSDRPIEEEKLNQILEAGRLAPTAVNYQPQRIYVLKSKEALGKVRGVTKMTFDAPVVLFVCYDKNVSAKMNSFGDDHDLGEMDACIVTTAMMMEATELGIGTLWARGFCAKDLSDAFELPENIIPVCLLDLGYPAEDAKPSPMHEKRFPLSVTVKEI